MSDDNHSRRTYLSILGGTGTVALAGCIASGQNDDEPNDENQNGDDFGDCVPPGQYECPGDSELVAIFNFDSCTPELEGDNECDISITVTEENDEGDSCEAFSFTYEVGDTDCTIENIRVYGGSDCQDFDSTDDEINTDLEAGAGGQQAGISNVRFCATVDDDDEMDDDDDEMDDDDDEMDDDDDEMDDDDDEMDDDDDEMDDDDEDDDEDKKKKPDVEDNVDLELVSKKDGDKYEFEITNDTDHDIKFSWGLDDTSHGGKVTVDGESSETFHVDADEEGTVYLYHDGEEVASVDVE